MSDIKTITQDHPVESRAHRVFASLMEIGTVQGILCPSDVTGIQTQSMALLQGRLAAYTENSSVRQDIAERIMASNLYTVGYALCDLPLELSIQKLQRTPPAEIYEEGKDLIWQDVERAKAMLGGILRHRIKTTNMAYNDTITKGIPLFFNSYDVDFFANETPGSIDYPLCYDAMDTCGIQYMLCYLKMLTIEHQLCNAFPTEDMKALLRSHSKSHKQDLINIFEIMVLNLSGNALLHAPLTLNIVRDDRLRLETLLEGVPPLKLKLMLGNTSHAICQGIGMANDAMGRLIAQSLMKQSPRVVSALKNRCLDTAFLTFKESSPALRFQEGASMDDVAFRRVIKTMANSEPEGKPALIHANAKSLTDLTDMLEASCIHDEEYLMVFASLDDATLAMLMSRTDDEHLHASKAQITWGEWLRRYLPTLDTDRQKRITTLSASIAETAL